MPDFTIVQLLRFRPIKRAAGVGRMICLVSLLFTLFCLVLASLLDSAIPPAYEALVAGLAIGQLFCGIVGAAVFSEFSFQWGNDTICGALAKKTGSGINLNQILTIAIFAGPTICAATILEIAGCLIWLGVSVFSAIRSLGQRLTFCRGDE